MVVSNFYLTAGYDVETLADMIVSNASYEDIIDLIEWIDSLIGDSVFTNKLEKAVRDLDKE